MEEMDWQLFEGDELLQQFYLSLLLMIEKSVAGTVNASIRPIRALAREYTLIFQLRVPVMSEIEMKELLKVISVGAARCMSGSINPSTIVNNMFISCASTSPMLSSPPYLIDGVLYSCTEAALAVHHPPLLFPALSIPIPAHFTLSASPTTINPMYPYISSSQVTAYLTSLKCPPAELNLLPLPPLFLPPKPLTPITTSTSTASPAPHVPPSVASGTASSLPPRRAMSVSDLPSLPPPIVTRPLSPDLSVSRNAPFRCLSDDNIHSAQTLSQLSIAATSSASAASESSLRSYFDVPAISVPVVRSTISSPTNTLRSQVNFNNCDFSYSIITGFTINSMKSCLLYRTTFINVTFVGDALHRSDCSNAEFRNCKFNLGAGTLLVEGAVFSQCTFTSPAYAIIAAAEAKFDEFTYRQIVNVKCQSRYLYRQLFNLTKFTQAISPSTFASTCGDILEREKAWLRDPMNKYRTISSVTAFSPVSDDHPVISALVSSARYEYIMEHVKSFPEQVAWSSLSRKGVYSTSAPNGLNGNDGAAGVVIDGLHGSDGTNGTDAGGGNSVTRLNEATFAILPDTYAFAVYSNVTSSTALYPLHDATVMIDLLACGGRGGDGGKGGHGGHGAIGEDGKSATKDSDATDGTNGGNGGNGADGGRGGDGGDGGEIIVRISSHDSDLLHVLGTVDVSGGIGGRAGAGGHGGQGGKGGKGGAPYVWVSYGIGFNGNVKMKSHARPPGNDGYDGSSGINGQTPQNGVNGSSGTYKIEFIDTGVAYNTPFQLSLESIAPIFTPTGVIEPEQSITIQNIYIVNTSDMPTPPGGVVQIAVRNNNFIWGDNHVTVQDSIVPHRGVTLSDHLSLRISDLPIPPDNTSLYQDISLELLAYLPRIDRYVSLQAPPQTLHVQYPVQLSAIAGSYIVDYTTPAVVLMKLRNICGVALGNDSACKRRVAIMIELVDNATDTVTLQLQQHDTVTSYHLDTPITIEVSLLPSSSEILLSGQLYVKQGKFLPNQHLLLRCSLLLGHLDTPAIARVVQVQTHSVQVVVPFIAQTSTNESIILVVNSSVVSSVIEHWRAVCMLLRKELKLYNVSLYNGMLYYEDELAINPSENTIVVIINTAFKVPGSDNTFYTDTTLSTFDIFEAAKRRNVRTYLIDAADSILLQRCLPTCGYESVGAYNSRREFYASPMICERLPNIASDPQYYTVNITTTLLYSTPDEGRFDSKVTELRQQLLQRRPDHSYYFQKCFDVQQLRGKYFKKFSYGSVQVRRGLDNITALVARRPIASSEETASQYDMFAVTKLLPFQEKMHLLCTTSHKNTSLMSFYAMCIVSDLADEQHAFVSNVDCTFNFKNSKINEFMVSLTAFTEYDFSSLCRTAFGKALLLEILVKLRSLKATYGISHRYFKKLMRLSITTVLNNYLTEVPFEHLRHLREELLRSVQYPTSEKLWSLLRDPLNVTGVLGFNTWLVTSATTSSMYVDDAEYRPCHLGYMLSANPDFSRYVSGLLFPPVAPLYTVPGKQQQVAEPSTVLFSIKGHEAYGF